MAIQTKANPEKIALGTLYSTLQLKAFLVNPDAAITSVDLAGVATRLAEELGTTAAMFQVKSDGASMIVIGDGHALDVDILARRVDKVLGGAGVLTGAGDTALVTVTQISNLYDQS